MSSLDQEPKGFFDGFTLWDCFAIFVCSDLLSSGIFAILSGGPIWLFIAGAGLWWLHETNVRFEVKNGQR